MPVGRDAMLAAFGRAAAEARATMAAATCRRRLTMWRPPSGRTTSTFDPLRDGRDAMLAAFGRAAAEARATMAAATADRLAAPWTRASAAG